jgi:hypothetical protein
VEPVKGLIGGRAATRWPGDGGKWQRWSVLGEVGVADSGASRAGVSVVMAGGAPRAFIVAGEGHAGARKGETTDGNGLNAIEGRAA